MKTLNLKQGTAEWLAARTKYFTASEAQALMGCSPYMTREDLLKYKTLKDDDKEIGYFKQKLFDGGHESEALARPFAEKIIGEDLYTVTGSIVIDGLNLLASFDGLTLMEDVVFEHKQWNMELARKVENEEITDTHFWQLEHQLLVSQAQMVIFMVSDGTTEKMVHTYYKSVPKRRKELLAAWKQFKIDLENYVPVEHKEKPAAEIIEQLPSLSIAVTGNVTASNIDLYQDVATKFIANINTDLKTDEDFSNAELTIKFCTNAEKELDLVKKQALSSTVDISKLFNTIDKLKEQMRSKRLEINKLVVSKKQELRYNIINEYKNKLNEFIECENGSLIDIKLPDFECDFALAMKGKKTIKSLHDSCLQLLSDTKIKISSVKATMCINALYLSKIDDQYKNLFYDIQAICIRENDVFEMIVNDRIAKQKVIDIQKQKRIEEIRKQKEETERLKLEREKEDNKKLVEVKPEIQEEIKQPDFVKPKIIEEVKNIHQELNAEIYNCIFEYLQTQNIGMGQCVKISKELSKLIKEL